MDGVFTQSDAKLGQTELSRRAPIFGKLKRCPSAILVCIGAQYPLVFEVQLMNCGDTIGF